MLECWALSILFAAAWRPFYFATWLHAINTWLYKDGDAVLGSDYLPCKWVVVHYDFVIYIEWEMFKLLLIVLGFGFLPCKWVLTHCDFNSVTVKFNSLSLRVSVLHELNLLPSNRIAGLVDMRNIANTTNSIRCHSGCMHDGGIVGYGSSDMCLHQH